MIKKIFFYKYIRVHSFKGMLSSWRGERDLSKHLSADKCSSTIYLVVTLGRC